MSDFSQEADWLRRVDGIRQHTRRADGGQRAPNKPLLLLYALALLQNDHTSVIVYNDTYHKKMENLLSAFGRPQDAQQPQLAFRYMTSNQEINRLWQVDTNKGADIEAFQSGTEYSGFKLKKLEAVGRLPASDEAMLLERPDLIRVTARRLLDKNWPPSLHADICDRLGLTLDLSPQAIMEDMQLSAELAALTSCEDSSDDQQDSRQRRDPAFRKLVLRAYEYKCAICKWDGRMGTGGTVALEAAHLRWHSSGGPDEPSNGLALCSIHHKLLDFGVLGLTVERRVLVSQDFVGGETTKRVTALSGKPLEDTQLPEHTPDEDHILWHEREVFKGPARPFV